MERDSLFWACLLSTVLALGALVWKAWTGPESDLAPGAPRPTVCAPPCQPK